MPTTQLVIEFEGDFEVTHARSNDPETSKAAAAAAVVPAARHAEQILRLLQTGGPAGATELSKKLGLDKHAVCRRLPDLQKKELIAVTDRLAKSSAGRNERVWIAV